MKGIAAIPARLGSTRLPRKVLADLDGRPLLWHVWHRALSAQRVTQVYVVTDAEEVRAAAESWGAIALMTPADCPSGTDRVAAALDNIPGDFILNVQGDEPLLDPNILDALIVSGEQCVADVVTPVYRLHDNADVHNPSVVKVVRARDGRALYFSRSPVPFVRDHPARDWHTRTQYWGHLGVYGFRRATLSRFPTLPTGPLEQAERLEQLRFLENGLIIQTVAVDATPMAVDTPDDLERVRRFVASRRISSRSDS